MIWPIDRTRQKGPRKSRSFANPKPAKTPIDPKGHRLLGFTLNSNEPIWGPQAHSLLLSAAGGGKTTRGLMPWLFSLLASSDRPAILILDSKDGEIAAQCVPMLQKLGVPTAVIDDTYVLPRDVHGRTNLNALQSIVQTHERDPNDLVFANDSVTHTLIEEPERDERNRYFRAWPRLIIEFAIYTLLKRNPALATPGGLWVMLSDPQQLARFAEIEAEEGTGMLRSLAQNIVGMIGHEHWPQHVQAAQDALRVFGVGSRLHLAGHKSPTSHEELIRKRAVIFLCGSQANMASLNIYYGLHLMAFTRAAYLRAGPLWIGADEFTNAPVKRLVESLTTLRAYQVSVAMIAQSRSEIERKLGKHETQTIEDNSIIKQWFGFSNIEEARRVSESMGQEHAVSAAVSGGNDTLKMNTNLSLIKQGIQSPAELMAMPPWLMLLHWKGLGYYIGRTVSQQNMDPYCDLIADNPLERGRLLSDPWITLTLPEEARR